MNDGSFYKLYTIWMRFEFWSLIIISEQYKEGFIYSKVILAWFESLAYGGNICLHSFGLWILDGWMGGGGGYPLTCVLMWEHFTPWSKSTNGEQDSISNVFRPTLIVWYYNEDWIRRVGVWVNSSGRSEWAQNANPMPPHFHLHQESNICTTHARHIPCFSKPWQLCKTLKTEMKLYPKDFCWVSKLRSIKDK